MICKEKFCFFDLQKYLLKIMYIGTSYRLLTQVSQDEKTFIANSFNIYSDSRLSDC
jgi:hypothetical protein